MSGSTKRFVILGKLVAKMSVLLRRVVKDSGGKKKPVKINLKFRIFNKPS